MRSFPKPEQGLQSITNNAWQRVLYDAVLAHLQAVKLIYSHVLLFSIIHPAVACALEVNRNASMFTDLLSKIFIPRLGLSDWRVRMRGGFMHYVADADVTFSHQRLDYILEPRPSFPDLTYLTGFYTTLLTFCMSWALFICPFIFRMVLTTMNGRPFTTAWPPLDAARTDN